MGVFHRSTVFTRLGNELAPAGVGGYYVDVSLMSLECHVLLGEKPQLFMQCHGMQQCKKDETLQFRQRAE